MEDITSSLTTARMKIINNWGNSILPSPEELFYRDIITTVKLTGFFHKAIIFQLCSQKQRGSREADYKFLTKKISNGKPLLITAHYHTSPTMGSHSRLVSRAGYM